MIFADLLRPPGPNDRLAASYKDWLHLNVFDAATGIAIVLNGAVQGAADDPRAVVSTTALVHHAGRWSTYHETVSRSQTTITERTLAVGDQLVVQLDPVSGGMTTTFRHPTSGLAVHIEAVPRTRVIQTVAPMPFGSGWIAWRATPLLRSKGYMEAPGRRISLDDALAYHDHNWGRWHWGEDIGWEWAAWPSEHGALVMSRATDRAHGQGAANVTIALPARHGWLNRSYGGSSVEVRLASWRRGCSRRLPGAMAALHAERSSPRLPGTIELRVDDGFDRMTARLQVEDAIQLIVADPQLPGYSYIHEMFGPFRASGMRGGERFAFHGRGVFEYVD
ncbi:hypothetical protein AB0H36_41835 [Kribbella sp. NPDC050820]|uniref:hypothetical protein n=1 Tax=Kribbella sp. NPDC050820 TaxID=3155408 RepID=UPI0034066B7E